MSNHVLIDKGALQMALNVLDRSGKNEVADELRNACREYAALQSVRPPFGVVSDEDVNVAYKAVMEIAGESRPWLARSHFRAALESYASRHAPTKD